MRAFIEEFENRLKDSREKCISNEETIKSAAKASSRNTVNSGK